MNTVTRESFLARRALGIGGSDIAAIAGLSNYKTPYDVWLSKTQPIDAEAEAKEQEEKPWLYWGSILEEVVAKEYAKRDMVKIQRVNAQLIHPEHHFAVANIDRAIVNPEIAGHVRWKDGRLTTDRLLECKTANGFAAHLWGEPGTDDVPASYLCQCQWYMGITRAERTDVAVLIGGSDFRTYRVHADADLFAGLLELASDFWKLVETGCAPDPQTVADAMARWPRHIDKKAALASVEVVKAVEDYADLGKQIKALEADHDALKVKILTAFEDAEILEDMGSPIATWKTQKASRLDAKALRADHPDIASLYTNDATSRVLRVKSKKD